MAIVAKGSTAMPIVAEGSTAMPISQKKRPLVMDDYLDFFDNRDRDLTALQLGQIISMHGFKKIKFKKNLLVEMVSTMDLMCLRRSTLQDGAVSGGARFTLEEVTKDLKDLDWQECHITSILSQGAGVSASSGGAVPAKRKKTKRLGKKAGEDGAEASGISSGTTVAAGSRSESSTSVDGHSLAVVCHPDFSQVPIATVHASPKRRRLSEEIEKVGRS